MTIDEMIAVLQAEKEGKTIQFSRDGNTWTDMGEGPGWNFNCFTFRVKPPEPMEIEIWVLENGKYTAIVRRHHAKSDFNGWTKKKFREVIE